ncbi:MAG: recombinase family protein [Elusimicrobiota bacterium]
MKKETKGKDELDKIINQEQELAAVYARISERERTPEVTPSELTNLEVQVERAKKLAEGKGYKIYDIYAETYTGTRLEGRVQFQRLLEDARRKKFTRVITVRFDRIFRNLFEFLKVLREWDELGIILEDKDYSFAEKSISGKILRYILPVIAEIERDLIAARTGEKLEAKAEKGEFLGGPPPLGYDLINKKLVVNKKEAKLVKHIFVLYLECRSAHKVAGKLNGEGYRTKKWIDKNGKEHGGKLFTSDSVLRILKNIRYTGKQERLGKLYKGIHTPIISEKLFNKVRELLPESAKSPMLSVAAKSGLLLLGIIKCGFCGGAMTTTFGKKGDRKIYYYKCVKSTKYHVTKKKGKPVWYERDQQCNAGEVPAEALDNFIADRVIQMSKDKKYLAAVFREAAEGARKKSEELEEQLNRKRNLLVVGKRKYEDFMNGLPELKGLKQRVKDDFINKINKMAEENDKLEQEIAELKKQIEIERSRESRPAQLQNIYKDFAKLYKAKETTQKQRKEWFDLLLVK